MKKWQLFSLSCTQIQSEQIYRCFTQERGSSTLQYTTHPNTHTDTHTHIHHSHTQLTSKPLYTGYDIKKKKEIKRKQNTEIKASCPASIRQYTRCSQCPGDLSGPFHWGERKKIIINVSQVLNVHKNSPLLTPQWKQEDLMNSIAVFQWTEHRSANACHKEMMNSE